MKTCPLCTSPGNLFYKNKKRHFYRCTQCQGIFIDPIHLPDHNTEKERYLKHNNDINDRHYQLYAKPVVDAVCKNHKTSESGLDFGAGTGPVAAKLLQDKGCNIKLYDPFFHKNTDFLNTTYEYIICCEVIEHFHKPYNDFGLLRQLLKNNGKLYCMTLLYYDNIDFETWWYKNDITHVFFYTYTTLEWVKEIFGFSNLELNNHVITFST